MLKKYSFLLLSLVLAVVLNSCGNSRGTLTYKVGILAPEATHGWVAGATYHAISRCHKLRGLGMKYKILTSDNVEEMTKQIEELKKWGAKAVVLYPQWKGMEFPIAQIMEEGIPVVSFDININVPGIHLVTGDNEEMGRLSARYIIEKIGKEGTVAILSAPATGSVSRLRVKGFMDVVKAEAPTLKLIVKETQFTQWDGQKDFAELMAENGEIDAVFSLDDECSIGVLHSLRQAKRTGVKVITGGGGSQEYLKLIGEIKDISLATTLYSPSMIRDAIDEAFSLARGQQVPEKKIIPTKLVDSSNYQEFLNPSSPY